MRAETVTLLVDNGSLEAAATLSLRRIARALGERVGRRVDPVSMRHSDRIPVEMLGGVAAETIEGALTRRCAAGVRWVDVVPMFFGPSGAVRQFLPDVVRKVAERFPGTGIRLCPTLHKPGDDRLARIIATNVGWVERRLARAAGVRRVALVDHGSPVRELTEVRDALAVETGAILGDDYEVAACSMERREGTDYDFNEPLLERLLATEGWNSGDVIVAMQFLQPGRHAGPEGDVASICRVAEAKSAHLRTHMTGLVGESPVLIDILADRLRQGKNLPE